MVLNKLDLNYKRQVNFLEISDFLYQNQELDLDNVEISLRTEENMDKFLDKINNAINVVKNQLPVNIIYEADLIKNKNKETDQIIIISLGDSSVGKTCFLNRYFKNIFSEEFLTTIGVDKRMKLIKINEKEYKLNFWDTAGQERYRSLPKKYYQNADGIFIIFDVTNNESFKNINYWIESIQEFLGDNEGKPKSIYLIGNKVDLNNRTISRKDAEFCANNIGLKYYETSSKINLNVNEVISRMILDCHMNISNINDCFIKSKNTTINTEINNNVQNEENNCCTGGNNKKNKNEKLSRKTKTRESLETIKSRESYNNDISEIKE